MSKEDLAFLRAHGLEPNKVARERLEGLLRRLRFEEAVKTLQKNPLPPDFDPVQAVREARQELERRAERWNPDDR